MKTSNTKMSNIKNLHDNSSNNSHSMQIKSALLKDYELVENEQETLEQMYLEENNNRKKSKSLRSKQNKSKKQKNNGIVVFSNKVISWKNSLDLVIRICLIAIATLAVILGLFFKNEINKSHAHWNIFWLLNMSRYDHKSGFQIFIHNNAFLIIATIYVTVFILPLTVFSKRRLFTIFFIVYSIGIIIWTGFTCLGTLKYNTFKNHTLIALFELISLTTSWAIFALLLIKLIRYKKLLNKQQ